MNILQGKRPDVTPVQLSAVIGAGVPIIASLLSSFGVYDLSPAQQDTLNQTVQWAALMAMTLFGADMGLRAARNHADARLNAHNLASAGGPPIGPLDEAPYAEPYPTVPVPVLGQDPTYTSEASDLPTDDEEFTTGGPDEEMFASYSMSTLTEDDVDSGPDSRVRPSDPEDI